jgi:hypothetical protein
MRALVACIFVVLAATALHAQEKIESSDATFFVQTAGGEPLGCVFDEVLVYRDQTYLLGALAGIRASLVWVEDKGNIGLVLKVTGVDMPKVDQDGDPKSKLFRIDHAFIAVDGTAVEPENSGRCEEPAAFCGSYWFPASAIMASALTQKKLALGFNRGPHGLAVTLSLDPSEAIRSKPEEFNAFADCMTTLAQRAKTKLRN